MVTFDREHLLNKKYSKWLEHEAEDYSQNNQLSQYTVIPQAKLPNLPNSSLTIVKLCVSDKNASCETHKH